MNQPLEEQVRNLWRTISGAKDAFSQDNSVIIASRGNYGLCPRGWIGIVSVGSSSVVETPDGRQDVISSILARNPLPDGYAGAAALFGEIAECLGPALLAYGSPDASTTSAHNTIGPLPTNDPRIQTIIKSASTEEQSESDLLNTNSGIIIATDSEGRPMSASGYREWPCQVAHLSVLTTAEARRKGYGLAAAAGAVELALAHGLLPQWRAAEANQASIALAKSLGLQVLGRQFSFKLA